MFKEILALTTVPKQILDYKIPQMSKVFNKQLNSEISSLILKLFPQIYFRLIHTNNRTIDSLFKYKDEMLKSVRSYIVYKYTSEICDSIYLGETTCYFKTHVAEHWGISSCTGLPSVSDFKSNVFLIF